MKKLFAMAFAAIMPMLFTACDDDKPFDRHDWYEWDEGNRGDGEDGRDGGQSSEPNGQQQSTEPLVGQWQGSHASTYYTEVWAVSGSTFGTICEFTDDGQGVQLDYDKESPRENYAYSPFTWTKQTGKITMTYVSNDVLTTATTDNYALTDKEFTGKMTYKGFGAYSFSLATTSGFDWSAYQSTAQAKTTRAFMQQLRQSNAKPMRCGTFAK
jgi:hypothetical protein